ncbi:DUF2614 family zinc ribbon-containing protein [Effusibacillus dendaii]|uniref:UPF0295 protein YgzB n=1 Tax=Effusibacillus dendaii TaxID=2743772 RepID=A0A7I8DCB4_9BACL|nr:DUF2614 family zinc ribbon-containing protein [Effusibacillus dendaii]BCJ86982.1 UPF0295 protein YgzB [Effusibacillus dendaii]
MKLIRLRNWALGLIFAAFILMYIGVFIHAILPVMFVIGLIMIAVSSGIYFRLGTISMQIPQVECPHCGKTTKVLGRQDGCAYCRNPIALDENGELILPAE